MQYSPEICDKLKVHCENGKSLESFCAHIGVSPKIIEEWFLEYAEFKEAVEMAPCYEMYYWEMELIRALGRADRETINVAKGKLERLSKLVSSPSRKNTYSNLKEPKASKNAVASSGDLVEDFTLLFGDTKNKKAITGNKK